MQVVFSVTVVLVNLSAYDSFCIMYVTVFVAIIQLEVFAAIMQVTVSSSNMWVTFFIVSMLIGVSVAIMQMVLSRMLKCLYYKMQETVSVIAI